MISKLFLQYFFSFCFSITIKRNNKNKINRIKKTGRVNIIKKTFSRKQVMIFLSILILIVAIALPSLKK